MYSQQDLELGRKVAEKIKKSGQSLYDKPDICSDLYIPNQALEALLDDQLRGLDLSGLPIRTRSKVLKSRVCEILGYEVPNSFKKTKPRFLAQNLDTYAQQSMNLQIWNEEIDAERRYAIIKLDNSNIVQKVRVISGDQLSVLDTTGKLTTKYQARLPDVDESILFSLKDTEPVIEWCEINFDSPLRSPTEDPAFGEIIPIGTVYELLLPIVGEKIDKKSITQERNRGIELQRIICQKLGFQDYADDGQYPDIRNQLIEIKLQTSPTIDLGLHSPSSEEVVVSTKNKQFTDSDIRYVIFRGTTTDDGVLLNQLFVVTGKEFTDHIPLFGGKVQNSKIQIPLPPDFFD